MYSNEAGQGSAPIAHATSKTENPIEEGMVSILEPFIDTIVVCTLTGLVILSSGVWNQKFENEFESSAMDYLKGSYSEISSEEDLISLRNYYYERNENIEFTGELNVYEGVLTSEDVTLMHNRSFAEETTYKDRETNQSFSGVISVEEGKIINPGDFIIEGKSLLRSADLTGKAFTKSVFGDYGQYIVAFGLLLFAFSTVIAWSYYGDRATAHLFGEGWILYYRIVYVGAFFIAAVVDTKIIWDIATVIGPIATIPNLIALILLRKEIKKIDKEYDVVKSPHN